MTVVWFLLFLTMWAALVGLVTYGQVRIAGICWWRDPAFGPVMWTTGLPMLGLIAAAVAYLGMRVLG